MTKTTRKKTVSKAVSRQRYSRITIKFYKKYQYEIKGKCKRKRDKVRTKKGEGKRKPTRRFLKVTKR